MAAALTNTNAELMKQAVHEMYSAANSIQKRTNSLTSDLPGILAHWTGAGRPEFDQGAEEIVSLGNQILQVLAGLAGNLGGQAGTYQTTGQTTTSHATQFLHGIGADQAGGAGLKNF